MGKLIDIFFEWAREERRWPLLAILTVPVIFKFAQEYFQLSFQAATGHWSFLISAGIVVLLSGAIYCNVNRQQMNEGTRLARRIARPPRGWSDNCRRLAIPPRPAFI